jgi:hypothetical protein
MKKKCKQLIKLALIAAAITGCGRIENVSQSLEHLDRTMEVPDSYRFNPNKPDFILPIDIDQGFHFIQAHPSLAGLVKKAHRNKYRLCLVDPQNSSIRRNMIVKSVEKWLDALRPIAKYPIASSVEAIVGDQASCDAVVNVGTYQYAHTFMGDRPIININSTGWYGGETVVLHEFGHAFGLLDTYEGRGGTCKPNQPDSVMCFAKYPELMPDDIDGVRAVYKSIFGSN